MIKALAVCLCVTAFGCDTPTRSTGIVNEQMDPRSEIRARMQAIDSDVTTLGLTPASHDACRLDDAVCDNAKHVCQLAELIASDGYAAEQCANANQACAASHAKCCAC
jgi:hypothetical protein